MSPAIRFIEDLLNKILCFVYFGLPMCTCIKSNLPGNSVRTMNLYLINTLLMSISFIRFKLLPAPNKIFLQEEIRF